MGRKTTLLLLWTAAVPTSAWAQIASEDSIAPGEIVVTAQKTLQRAQDVPLVVTAVKGETLSDYGVGRVQDIAATTPALQVDSYFGVPGYYSLALRGITTGSLVSSTVATYIDDVPLGSSGIYAIGGGIGLDLFPYDLDHVEILEGPQGTLYGASSMGGLLKYVTRTPSLDKNQYRFGGDVMRVSYGSKAGWSARGSADVVLVPGSLSLGISGSHRYTPGFVDNVATGKKDYNHGVQDGVRAVLYWKPSDELTAKVQGLYDRSNFKGYSSIAVNGTGAPLYGLYKTDSAAPQYNKNTVKLLSADIDYDFGFAELSSTTSYTEMENINSIDASVAFSFLGVDAAFVTDPLRVKKFTQELRLASPAEDRFHWMVGTFYTKEKAQWDTFGFAYQPGTTTPAPGFNPLLVTLVPSRFREWAVFGNATFKITDEWDVSGGLRYSRNKQRVSQDVSGLLVGPVPLIIGPVPSSDGALTFSLSSSYHIDPNAMLYARISSGYRPGGPNFLSPGVPLTFSPDRLTNYELGIKSDLFDKKLMFNLTGFYINWRKVTLQGTTPVGLSFITNGGSASSKGVELTTSLKVARGLTVGGSLSYTDAKLEDDAAVVSGQAGDQLPYTARWAGAVTADYIVPVADDTDASFGLVWRYTGPRNQQFPNAPIFHRLRSYNKLDLKAGVSRGNVDVNLFVRNATNSHRYVSWPRGYNPLPLDPRTIGLSLDFKFD